MNEQTSGEVAAQKGQLVAFMTESEPKETFTIADAPVLLERVREVGVAACTPAGAEVSFEVGALDEVELWEEGGRDAAIFEAGAEVEAGGICTTGSVCLLGGELGAVQQGDIQSRRNKAVA